MGFILDARNQHTIAGVSVQLMRSISSEHNPTNTKCWKFQPLLQSLYMRAYDVFGNISELHSEKIADRFSLHLKSLRNIYPFPCQWFTQEWGVNIKTQEWRLSFVGIRARPSRVKEVTGKSLALAISTTKEFVYLMKKQQLFLYTKIFICELIRATWWLSWGSHDGNYEKYGLLDCNAMS
jgi:hypothetical protein